jgi:sigma-B regulation protein RsbU (phosphoserine phosphatase)
MLLGRGGVRRLHTGGLLLGAFKDASFEQETVQLESNDVLVVFSDGVTEALNADGAEFGDDRLAACTMTHSHRASAELLQCILDAVRDFSQRGAQSDDSTLIILRYVGVADETRMQTETPLLERF